MFLQTSLAAPSIINLMQNSRQFSNIYELKESQR